MTHLSHLIRGMTTLRPVLHLPLLARLPGAAVLPVTALLLPGTLLVLAVLTLLRRIVFVAVLVRVLPAVGIAGIIVAAALRESRCGRDKKR